MFYTLASKISLIPPGSNHFLIVFILGSLAYIALNYYLYSGQAPAFLDSYKFYAYVLMAIDLAIAYFLSKGNYSVEDEEEGGYSKEDKRNIDQGLQMLRKTKQGQVDAYNERAMQLEQEKLIQAQYQLQLQKQKQQQEEYEEQSVTKSQQSPFKTIEENEEDDRREKEEKEARSKSSKKTESSDDERPQKAKKTQKQKKNVRETDEDTDLPIYGMSKR